MTTITSELQETLDKKAKDACELGARVEIIGAWVWAWFDGKPPADILTEIKAMKFRWNPRRKCWQYAGIPSRKSPARDGALKAKYGARRVDEETA